jgi:hypothetical protein
MIFGNEGSGPRFGRGFFLYIGLNVITFFAQVCWLTWVSLETLNSMGTLLTMEILVIC